MLTEKGESHGSLVVRRTITAIKESYDIAKDEGNSKYWRFNGRPAIDSSDSYENNFRFVGRELMHPTGKGFIRRFLERKIIESRQPLYLDLAGGDCTAARSLVRSGLIKAGLTVNLSDLRSQEQIDFDNEHSLYCLPNSQATGELKHGNLLLRKTWNGIDNWLSLQSQALGEEAYFDLITAWPGGAYAFNNDIYYRSAVHGYPPPPEAYAVLLKRSINRLSHKNGMLLAQVPASIYEYHHMEKFRRFMKDLRKYKGLSIHFKQDLNDWDWDEFPNPRTWGCGIIKVEKSTNKQFVIK